MTAGLVTAPKASLTKLLAAYLREPSPRHSLIGSHLLPWTAWPLPTAWLPSAARWPGRSSGTCAIGNSASRWSRRFDAARLAMSRA